MVKFREDTLDGRNPKTKSFLPGLYVLIDKVKKEVVQMSYHYTNGPNPFTMVNNYCEKNAIDKKNASVYLEDNKSIHENLEKFYQYNLVFGDDGEFTGFDFTPHTEKKSLNVTMEKTSVKRDGVDFVLMEGYVLNSDETIDRTFTEDIDVEVSAPNGLVFVRCSFVEGKMSRRFYPELIGRYEYPAGNLYCCDDKLKVGLKAYLKSVYDATTGNV